MKPIPSTILRNSALALAGWLTSFGLEAAQLAYDGFDYPSGSSNLSGQAGGSGWNGVWQTVSNGSADVLGTSLVAAGNAPADYDLRSIGGSNLVPNARRVGRRLDTSAAGPFGSRGYLNGSGRIGADGKTLYVSFIQQPNGTSLYYEFEFHRGDLGDPGRIAGIGNDQAGDGVHLRAPNSVHTLIGAGSTSANFYVVRIDFKAGNDDVYVYQNPTSLTEPGVPTLTRLGVADMSFDGIAFGAFVNGRTVAHDEVRFGESWADVTVPENAAPAVVRQPRASSTGYVGSRIVLSSEFSGQPLPTYQWYKDGDLLPGETHATLSLNSLQSTDAGDYHVEAINAEGSAESQVAHVEVIDPPEGLLAYEGFDYDAGLGVLAGKSGGLGWGANWVNVNGVGGSVVSGSLVAGTNAPNGYDDESLGNSAHIPNAQRDGRLLDTSPTGRFGAAGYVNGSGHIGADGKTIYVSFLQQPDGTTKFFEFEFHRDNLGDPGRIGGVGNDTSNPTVSLRTAGTQNLIGPGSTGVNFYVVRIDFKPGNDDVTVYQNPVSATEPAMATLHVANAADMSFNGISIAAFENGRTVKHDEIRIGQSWSDVVFGSSRRDLVWIGDGTLNEWDFSTTNWDDGSGVTAFIDGDPVTFDDTGSDSPAVNVGAQVSTAHLTVNNTAKNYVFGGSGSIESSGGLTKAGTGSLDLTLPVHFGSSMVVNGGNLTMSDTSTTAGELLLNAGSGVVTLSGDNSFSGRLDAKSGSQILSGTSSFSGLVTTSSEVTISGTVNFLGGGSVFWLGNLTGSNSTLTIEPGAAIQMTGNYNDALVIGRDGGSGKVTQHGGTFTYQPANRDSAFIGASASTPGTTATYEMHDGTLDMSNMRLGIALGVVTADLYQTGGSILVRQLDLGSILTQGDGTYEMEGGTMTIGAGGITTTSNQYSVLLGGGTLRASANWQSSLDLTLTGTGGDTTIDTNGHSISLSGEIQGTGGFVKIGEGTLTLTQVNSFTGITTVAEGVLAGLGNSDNSHLTVDAGATLAPGTTTTGVFRCASALLNSGSTLRVKIDSTLDDADQIQASSSVDLTDATLELNEIGSGTIDAGEDLVIVNTTGGIIGTFEDLPEGATLSAGANTFTIHYSPTQVTLTSTTVANPYVSWTLANGLDGSPGKDPAFEADPEGDGIANGLEWVLGGQPLVQDASTLLNVSGDGTNGLVLSFLREEDSIGFADLVVQWSDDLGGTWTDVAIGASGGTYPDGVVVAIDDLGSPDLVTVTIPASNAPNGKLFARVKVLAP